jgi:aminopeptidase N
MSTRVWIVVALLVSPIAISDRAAAAIALVQTFVNLELSLDYEEGTLTGTASLTLENTGAAPITQLPLQLGRLMEVGEIFDEDGHAVSYVQDVVRFEDWPQYQVNQVDVDLAPPIQPGNSRTITLRYSGLLVGYTESGMFYVQDHIDRDFTILRSEARAFPVVAVPSLRALRRAPQRDFSFGARITVPRGLTVATGVPELERVDSSDATTWVFRSQEPVPFLNIEIAPYQTLARGGVRVYYFPVDSLGAQTVMLAIDRALQLYEEWFGPLGREPEFNIIEIPEGWGSQASLTGGIIQTADAFRDRAHLVQLYHELAHLWHPRDLDRPAPRWNEGLAMFLQQRVAVQLDAAEALDTHMQAKASTLAEQLRESEALRTIPMIDYGKAEVTGFSYRTGMLLFYVLYELLGEDAFDALLRGYFEAFRDSGSTTHDFVDHVAGKSNIALRPVFDDWLFTTQWARRLTAGESLNEIVASYR